MFWKPGVDRASSGIIEDNADTLNNQSTNNRSLPILQHKNSILYSLETSNLVIVGETSSGKSTQVPQFLHDSGWTSNGMSIACSQPKKLAAISLAKRVASEMGCVLGNLVGYNVRFDRKISSSTKINFCTDDILLKELIYDPLLSKYSVIIIDEFHCRSLSSDLLISILKKVLLKRSDLRIIIMSATINAIEVKDYLERNNSKLPVNIISIIGRTYPIELFYLSTACQSYIDSTIQTIQSIHIYEPSNSGDILVFLPSSEDIDEIYYKLSELKGFESLLLHKLHNSLPNHIQLLAIQENTSNYGRKVILSTNIAETSLTIDNIVYVIDSGFVKLNYYDSINNLDMFVTTSISKASAIQRMGRCARKMPGKCYRLYTEDTYNELTEQTLPEILRKDISYIILQLKTLGINNIIRFDYITNPTIESILNSLELLYSLNLIDINGNITKYGEIIIEIPINNIRLAKILLISQSMNCCEEILTIVSMLSVEYPFISINSIRNNETKLKYNESLSSLIHLNSDHLTLLNIYNNFDEISANNQKSWCDSKFLSYKILLRANEIRNNLKKMLIYYLSIYEIRNNTIELLSNNNSNSNINNNKIVLTFCNNNEIIIIKCLISGYFSNVAKLNNDGKYHTFRNKIIVMPHNTSVIANYGILPEWIIYSQVIHSKTTQIRDITKIEPLWLIEIANHYFSVVKQS